jgi:hypothetical protein
MKINENEGMKILMIGNVLELQEEARREIVVGEVGTVAHEFSLLLRHLLYMLQ